MVRTAETVRVGSGRSKSKKTGDSSRSSASHNVNLNEKGGGGGNPVCPRETPGWQKPITSFFCKLSDVDQHKPNDPNIYVNNEKKDQGQNGNKRTTEPCGSTKEPITHMERNEVNTSLRIQDENNRSGINLSDIEPESEDKLVIVEKQKVKRSYRNFEDNEK